MRLLPSLGAALLATAAACNRSPSASPSPSPASAPSVAQSSSVAALPPGVTRGMIAQGDTIFNTRSCVRCHGANGVGSVRGPSLTDQTWIHIDGSYDAIVSLVTTGFTKAEQKDPQYQFSMNPRGGGNLTDEQIRAVAAYAWSLSRPGTR
jgi:mono/diheme cytochrome c family protein